VIVLVSAKIYKRDRFEGDFWLKYTIPKILNKYSKKGIGRSQSHFPPILLFMYSQDRSAYSAAGKYVDRFRECI
jgi:hypothetical protein